MKIVITLNDGFVIDTIMNIEEYDLVRLTSCELLLSRIRNIIKVGKENGKQKHEL